MQLIPSGLGCADRARQMKNNYRFNRVNNKNMIQVGNLVLELRKVLLISLVQVGVFFWFIFAVGLHQGWFFFTYVRKG